MQWEIDLIQTNSGDCQEEYDLDQTNTLVWSSSGSSWDIWAAGLWSLSTAATALVWWSCLWNIGASQGNISRKAKKIT